MIYVGIDVAKDKHDCFITNSELEATRHYSFNLLRYLIDKSLPIFVINPLHTNLFILLL